MITITDKHNCCGCAACVQICPKHCISMKLEDSGFYYPHIDTSLCVDCGACEKVCPFNSPTCPSKTSLAYAANNSDSEIKKKSSSGGIFHELAKYTIDKDGVVFGARFDDKWNVVHDSFDDIKHIGAYRGSKYVQSNMHNTFVSVKQYLNIGRYVLFSGTPCQIKGLKRYLRKDYEKLITVDVACHGVPSPMVWSKYVNMINDVLCYNNHREIYKRLKKLNYAIFFHKDTDTIELRSKRHENDYTLAFIHGIILRPSCYSCKVKNFSSGSDITIADFWGIQKLYPEYYDPYGTSLIFANTDKGKRIVKELDIHKNEVDANSAIQVNPALTKSSPEPSGIQSTYQAHNDDLIMSLRADLSNVVKKCNPFVYIFKKILRTSPRSLFCTSTRISANLDMINSAKYFEHVTNGKNMIIQNIDFRNKSDGWIKYLLSFNIKLY